MGRSDIRVTIERPLKFVFDVYTQPDTWAWSDIRKLAWTEGKPWEVDSRCVSRRSSLTGQWWIR